MATDREVAASLAQRVLDEFGRTGAIPAELVRHIQIVKARKDGTVVPAEDVERYVAEWINTILTERDNRIGA